MALIILRIVLFALKKHRKNTLIILMPLLIAACARNDHDAELPSSRAVKYPHGSITGNTIRKTIDPAGGILASEDGSFTIAFPEGAVSTPVTATLTPIGTTLPGGGKQAFRLGPEGQTFNRPVELTYHYENEDLDGSAQEMLYLAYQDAAGYWTGMKNTHLDTTLHTLTVETKHFSDWNFYRLFELVSDTTDLGQNEEAHLELHVTDEEAKPDKDGLPLTYVIKPEVYHAQENITGWQVIGPGTVNVSDQKQRSTYRAPTTVPASAKAAVEVSLKNVVDKKDPGRAGHNGLVLVRKQLNLVATDFHLIVDGTPVTAGLASVAFTGSFMRIHASESANSAKIIDIDVRADGPGTYAYGSETGTATITCSYAGGRPGHSTFRQRCPDGQFIFSEGAVQLTEAGSHVKGSFSATVWRQDLSKPELCAYTSHVISGNFNVTR